MIVELSIAEALRAIVPRELRFDDAIVPRACEQRLAGPYRPEYAWLPCAERRVAGALGPLGGGSGVLLGPGGLVSEALSNAFCHGNGRDPRLPIRVRVVHGERGLLLRIQDCGSGFDVGKVLGGFRSRRRYWQVAGNGLRAMDAARDLRVFWGDGGTAFHLLHVADPVRPGVTSTAPREARRAPAASAAGTPRAPGGR